MQMRAFHYLSVVLVAVAFITVSGNLRGEETVSSPSELAAALGAGDDTGYARAFEPRSFSFPADHGPHPAFRNEWWYVTGNLDGGDGRRFGYELTIFRVALTPGAPESTSAWRTNQLYFAHFALTDAGKGAFHFDERFSRGAAGLAGAEASPFRVWLDDWSITEGAGGRWRLVARTAEAGIDVTLDPVKPPVLQGDDGLSRKSAAPGNASYYYSLTRLRTGGEIVLGGTRLAVAGTSWLDREWSTSALAPDQAGWDWFALQLDDGTELMFYILRRKDGTADAHSAGTFVDPAGELTRIANTDLQVEVTGTWQSALGGAYPARWSLQVPTLDLSLEITPVVANQELDTIVRYWEGAVDAAGTRNGRPIGGRGYVELTGYAK
jgi:predicted secreted hydrolase